MEVLAAVVGRILTCACSCINAPLDEQCRYLRDPTKQIKALKDKKEELIAREKDIKEKLKAEVRQGKRCTEETQNWLDVVSNFVDEFDKIEEKFAVGRRCLKGVYPNCHSRVKLGRHITKLINDVNHLLQRADRISESPLTHPVQEIGWVMGTTKLVGVAATQKITKMVWEHLMGDQVDIIGVYGMGGVGKTTIMKNINDQLIKESTHFKKVVWVTGSKDGNIRKLQMGIGKDFNINLLDEPDESRWSSRLLTKLPRMGRILFILDDMWEAFSLMDIGIPNLKENNCKLVLTTRSFEVCRRMGCKEPIKVELLSEDEAWELFIDIVDVKLAPEVENVARDAAAECSRLPLAIVTVASAMKGNDDIRNWRVALSDLRDSTDTNLEEKVIGPLKFSYNKLSEHDKKCFQYCALFPEDYEILAEDLIDHWVMDGLISEKKIQQELDRGCGILNRLVHSCMLERDYRKDWRGNYNIEFVKMHDLVRDMAIGTVKTNPRFVVKAGLILGESLDEKEWEEDAEKISFMHCGIEKIAVSPNCPRLTTLLLGGNDKLEFTADAFFARMQNLRVLNLSCSYPRNLKITWLPESLSELVNLHVLDASGIRDLKTVPSLQKLRSLRVLRLQETGIQELPRGMEALVNLRRLDVSDTKLSEIRVSLITNFSLLQELLIYPCCISFSDPLRSLDFLVEQLLSLSHLERVSLNFNNLSDFICCARSKTLNHLDSFSFAVRRDDFRAHIPGRNNVDITNYSNEISEDTLVLPQNTEDLHMFEFNEFSSFSELSCLKDVRGLRTCRIEDCSGMECIFSSSEHRNELQHLQSLHINTCPKFTTLCKGVAAPGILPSLQNLEIRECSNLKYLFASFKLFCQLQKLKTLSIYRCVELEELIASEDAEEEQVSTEGSNTASPTLLELLDLRYLPKLKTLFSKPMMHYFQKLKTLIIWECAELEELIASEEAEEEQVSTEGSNTASPTLEILLLEGLPKLKTLFSKPMMQNVKELKIDECHGLKYLFSFEMLEHLKHLQNVYISRCEELEAVIAEAEVGGDSTMILLPSLTELFLCELPKLKSICRRGEMVCESLQTVEVVRCAELKRLPLLRGEDQLPPPSLKRIKGSRKWWDSLEWDSPFVKTILQPRFDEYKEASWDELFGLEESEYSDEDSGEDENGIDGISQHTSTFSIPNFDPDFQIGIASVEGQSTPPIHQRIKGRRKQLNSQNILNLSGEDVFQAPTTTTAASLLPTTSEQNNTLNQTGHDKLFDFDLNELPVLHGVDEDEGVIDDSKLLNADSNQTGHDKLFNFDLNELPVLQGEDEDEDGGNSQQIQLFPV